MNTFISPEYASLLRQHQLDGFAQLWAYQGDWFELPNHERGGWSGVNYIELTDNAGQIHGFYLKRQQAHMRLTWKHPIAGEPTFVREYEILKYLRKHNVAAPELVFFESQNNTAILLTKALTGYTSADRWLKNAHLLGFDKKRGLMRALAIAVRHLHQAGVQHRSLYAKHLFVKEKSIDTVDGGYEVAVIDFEKSRITPWIAISRFSDLITLNYRTSEVSRTERLYFFKQYFELKKLTPFFKKLCAYMHFQSQKNRST